jgi:hypothetical protein
VEEARDMSENITAQQREDPGNPYSAPAVDFSDPWSDGPADALALRRAHRREESFVKGLAIANFLYALLFGTGAAYEFSILIGHLAGRVDAPWIVRPGWIASLVLTAFLPIAALGAACGFLRRKRWALSCELAFAACWFGLWAIEPLIKSDPRPALEFIGLTAGHLMLAAPMLSAWYLRRSPVFGAEYSDSITATRQIWFWPRIPAKIVLAAIVFFVVALVLVGLSQRQ